MKLHNSLSRKPEDFVPQDPSRVTMYVCGPTIYAQPHIGNARPAIVFDVLFRLLRHHYGEDHVAYTRNYTDIDDKIIAAAAERGVSTYEVTLEAGRAYKRDMSALHVMEPTFTPLATSHVHSMWNMIEVLMKKGHAYEVDGEIFFHVPSNPHSGLAQHGELEGHNRVEPDPRKRDPRDFVLWKPTKPGEPELWHMTDLVGVGLAGILNARR
jgi:cysteinyl-tRNA synthetase